MHVCCLSLVHAAAHVTVAAALAAALVTVHLAVAAVAVPVPAVLWAAAHLISVAGAAAVLVVAAVAAVAAPELVEKLHHPLWSHEHPPPQFAAVASVLPRKFQPSRQGVRVTKHK